MRITTSTLFILVILLGSCNNKHQHSQAYNNKAMIASAGCYSSVTGKDTFNLKLDISADQVGGKLNYKFFQKDNLNGEFTGQLLGDTLLADYKFLAEGTVSVRQVTFLLKDSTAIEGYGAMEEKAGKMVFKNLHQLSFGKGLILKKVLCTN